MSYLNIFSRISEDEVGTPLPEEWIKDVKLLLDTTYEDFCLNKARSFQCFGESYQKELLLIASIIDPLNKNSMPTTFSLSVNIESINSKDLEKVLKNSVNVIGGFIDIFIATESWDEFCSTWTFEKRKKIEFHYTVTRENITLSLEANKLLEKINLTLETN